MPAISNPAVADTLADLRRNAWHIVGRRGTSYAGDRWNYYFPENEIKQFRAMRNRGAIIVIQDHRVSPIALLAKLAQV